MAPVKQRKSKKTKAWFINEERSRKQIRKENKHDDGFLVKFSTKQAQYAIPGNAISVKGECTPSELNRLISSILKEGGFEGEIPKFDFLVEGEILASSLTQLMNSEKISRESVLKIEYLEKNNPPKPQDSLEHDDWVSSVSYFDHILLTGCYDNTVQLWDAKFLEKGRGKKGHILTINAHKGPVKAVTWIKNSTGEKFFVSSSFDQTSTVWRWKQKSNRAEKVWSCKGHTQSIECVASQKLGTKFATGSWDTNLKIWDADPNSESGLINEFEPDAKKFKSKKTLKVPIMTLAGHSEAISGVEWMSEKEALTCSWDHSIRQWDLEASKSTSFWSGNISNLCLSYSNINQTFLVGCTDRFVRLYDPRSKVAIMNCKYGAHKRWVSSIRWHTEHKYLFVTGSYDKHSRLWDSRSPKAPLYSLEGHKDKVLSVDWTNKDFIATGSADCTAKVFSFLE